MRLGWDEIRRRAKAFSEKHADKSDERADAQLFINDFFKIFGMSSRQIGRYERRVADVSMKQRGFIDFFWPGQLIVEMKSRGKDLAAAEKQALDYVPIGWLEPPIIPSNLVRVLTGASLWDFALLTSAMHMAWLAHMGGRLKSDYRYSVGLVYNTFPWPDASPAQRAKVEELAQAVLDARAAHPASSLADLYDPDTMPADLRKAHTALDHAVDRLYRREPFQSDRDRVEHLFGRYEALVNPLEQLGAAKNRRVAKKAAKRGGGA